MMLQRVHCFPFDLINLGQHASLLYLAASWLSLCRSNMRHINYQMLTAYRYHALNLELLKTVGEHKSVDFGLIFINFGKTKLNYLGIGIKSETK